MFDIKLTRAADPLEPALILPEVVDPKSWYEGKLPWSDKEQLVFNFMYFPYEPIGIHTELVKPEEIKSYYDLLDPRWKGKIIINDPTITGRGFNSFSTMVYHKVLDLDFFRQIVSQQQPLMTRDQRLQVEWLARKKYLVAIWPHNVQMAEFQKMVFPLAWIAPKEGAYIGSGSGALVLMNRSPHPNTARIFINWLLSKEGQLLMQNFSQQQSAKADIATEGLDPIGVRKPERQYYIAANEIEKWLLEEQDKYLELARQIFGPLMGK